MGFLFGFEDHFLLLRLRIGQQLFPLHRGGGNILPVPSRDPVVAKSRTHQATRHNPDEQE